MLFTLLWLATHVTVLKLRSDWRVQIPTRVVNWTKLFAQSHQTLFPPQGWGLGTRLYTYIRRQLTTITTHIASSDDHYHTITMCPLPCIYIIHEHVTCTCSSAATMYMARTGSTAPFIVMETDILSSGIPSKRI